MVLSQFANDANCEIPGLVVPGMVWSFMQDTRRHTHNRVSQLGF